jgi:putative ABC transport system permease protein
MLRRITTRLTSLFRRTRLERELDAELRFHIDMLTEQQVRAGLPQDEARRKALRDFGVVARVKDDVRDAWLSRLFETLAQDARYGLKNLRRNPGFALVVILTMALGIGANTAIFSVVNGVLLQPLPYRDGDRLVVLRQQQPLAGVDDTGFSVQEIRDYRTRARSLEDVAEFHNMWFILLGRAEPERIATGVVSANFFAALGVRPAYGRDFQDADDKQGAPAVLILSDAYWRRSFHADPTVLGRVFKMNDRPHQVIGILPPVTQYPLDVDVYMPTSACPFRSAHKLIDNRNGRMMQAFGRLKPGIAMEKARADLEVVAAGIQAEHPDVYLPRDGYRMSITPLKEEMTREFRTTLLVLLGTAGFVLLIVCASVANLTLARMVRREREIAIRSVLGAGRLRLLRQLLTESLLLSILGGTLGVAIAAWGVDLLVAYAARFTPRAAEIGIDKTVLLYTFAISVLTGLVFGSVPAFSGPLGMSPALKDGGRTTQNSQAVRSVLIVVQVAASFMLLIGAGLTLRTVLNLQRVDPGFKTDNLLTMRIDLNFSKYKGPQIPAFWERLEERLRAEPGVLSAGGGGTFPLNERGPFTGALRIQGRESTPNAPRLLVDYYLATAGYFSTIGQPLLAGRAFEAADRDINAVNPVVIINKSMARHYWPDQDPVGRRIGGDGEQWFTIVGVVADTLQQLKNTAHDEVYLPLMQTTQLSTTWLLRTGIDPAQMEKQIRNAVHAIDPDQPVDHFRTVAEVRRASLESPRLTAVLLGLFALLALVITAAGIAGVIAFSVNQRTQEFGIRMALGAQRTSVLAMVLRQGIALVLIGLALGMAGAVILTRALTTILFGVQPTDALTFVAVSMVLVAVAAAACLIPARRAASVDPMVALRVS